MESMGLLKAIPLVIIKAVTENNSQDGDGDADSDDEDSEPEVDNPMPRHFDNTDEGMIYQPPINRSRSNSPAVSLDFEAGSNAELRPSSACTDNSDTSVNVSFDPQGTQGHL